MCECVNVYQVPLCAYLWCVCANVQYCAYSLHTFVRTYVQAVSVYLLTVYTIMYTIYVRIILYIYVLYYTYTYYTIHIRIILYIYVLYYTYTYYTIHIRTRIK